MSALQSDGVPHRTWMVPKKGLSGNARGYKPYLIHRFLCKDTGRTVAMHPRFSHTGKRFTLAFVVKCLKYIIELGKSICAVSKKFVVYRKTLSRWMRGFCEQNFNAKWACFFHGDLPREAAGFAPALLRHFRTTGNGNIVSGTASAMVRLQEMFSRRLY
jgi:hypothetical protein